MNPNLQKPRRRLKGVVTSTAMKHTAAVRIERRIPHPKYGKYFPVSRKFLIDDPQSAAQVGDLVEFEECRPLSRHKCWRLVRVLKKGVSLEVAADAALGVEDKEK